MQRRWTVLIILALFLSTQASSPAYADDSEQQVVNLVNAERARQGLAPLAVSTELTNAARSYANAMAVGGFFGHVGRDGSTFISRDLGAGYSGATFLGENLAAGQTSPEQAFTTWMASPDHRANVLSPKATEIGVGHVYRAGSPYGHYWVQEFGNRGVKPVVARQVSSRGGARTMTAPSTLAAAPAAIKKGPTNKAAPTPAAAAPASPPASLSGVNSAEDLGRSLSAVIPDPAGTGLTVQYYQRAVLEWHPENSPRFRIQHRLLGDILYPSAEPPLRPADAPPGRSEYFPLTPNGTTGLGHFVANTTRTGQPIYFADYFDSHGGVSAFGFPKDEPRLVDGLWTQHFQAAVFQYHPEYDRDGTIPDTDLPWRYFRVQLKLLGEEYVAAEGLILR